MSLAIADTAVYIIYAAAKGNTYLAGPRGARGGLAEALAETSQSSQRPRRDLAEI